MDGYVHGARKAGGGAVGQAAAQGFLGSIGDRMHDEIELAPALRHLLENGFQFAGLLDVAGGNDRALQRLGQWPDVWVGLVVQVGDGQLGPGGAHRPCAA